MDKPFPGDYVELLDPIDVDLDQLQLIDGTALSNALSRALRDVDADGVFAGHSQNV